MLRSGGAEGHRQIGGHSNRVALPRVHRAAHKRGNTAPASVFPPVSIRSDRDCRNQG
jgi:hypothetical protein